ncbi:MAG: tetratricopeptide repeat protein [bacterium]
MGKPGHKTLTQKNLRLLFGGWKEHAAAALVLAVLVAAVYWPALQAPFLYDDQRNITENPYIRMTELSKDQVKRAMVQDKFQLRPVANLSFAFDHLVHRLNKKWMHAENMVLHFFGAFCLYLLISLLMKQLLRKTEKEEGRSALWLPLPAAAAWAVHPVQTQAVTYIVQRQTLMAACFSLLAFLFYLSARYKEDNRLKALFILPALLSFLVAATSKEIASALPVVCILYELLLIRRKDPKASRNAALGLVVFTGLLAVLAGVALFATGLGESYLSSYAELGYGPWQRLLTESRIIAGYLGAIAFPHPVRLALDHHPQVSASLFSPVTTLPAVLLMIAVLAAGAFALWRGKLTGLLFLGFMVSLAPESSFIPVELEYDHRMYLPSLFVIPPVVLWLLREVNLKSSAIFMCVVILMLSALSFSRNQAYGSKLSIWADTVEKAPGKVRPWSNLCGALLEEQRPHQALTACRLACELGPDNADPFINRAVALYRLGRNKKAGSFLSRAVAEFPESASARFNYGRYLEKIEKKPASAQKQYRRALKLDPFLLKARLALALLLREKGENGEALKELGLLVRLYPDCGRCWGWYGLVAYERGYMDGAHHALSRASNLDPESGVVRKLERLIRSGRSLP